MEFYFSNFVNSDMKPDDVVVCAAVYDWINVN